MICPLYRGCPLFGGSVIRGFTVLSLPCLHTFWHVIPISFYIFNIFIFSAITSRVAIHTTSGVSVGAEVTS